MSRRIKAILIIVLVLILGGGIFYVWNKMTGRFKIGADQIVGCQSSYAISSFVGPPGANLTTYSLFGHDVTVNEKIIGSLDNVQKEISDAKITYNFDDVQTYNNRYKRWGGGLSLHAYGIAIDLNPGSNGAGSRGDIPDEVINIFKKNGFAWGGDWEGASDPMHFEWYGSTIYGSAIDSQSGQKVTDVAFFIDDNPAIAANGDYGWTLGATRPYKITLKSPGYEDNNFDVALVCFQDRQMDIALKALPENTPGTISGKVTLPGNRPPLLPPTIYLDDRVVGSASVTGDYQINNVRKGNHKVEARILFFPSSSVMTGEMKPGAQVKNLNFVIGG